MKSEFTNRSFVLLRQVAEYSMTRALANSIATTPDCVTAAMFAALMFEAHLNHVGSLRIPHWEHLERLPWKVKASIIREDLGLPSNWGEGDLQALTKLFKFRDWLAHGRTATEQNEYEDGGDTFSFRATVAPSMLAPWRDPGFVERGLESARSVCRSIHAAAGLGDWDMELLADGIASG